ncbi:hypothetical protein L1049_018586 [Liquidambar formosana]|uniref:DDT domain-containing protein DDR4 n=1 Tax=Liquidambar formosana TaxID=63359 RepID=A0AAP0WN96_LIQFO
MVEGRRRPAPAVTESAGEEKGFFKGEIADDPIVVSDQPVSGLELARLRLRERWELASVLNFLNVFEPIIGKDLKMSAEEIETGLIEPNSSLAKLHISLLKGIPPVSKTLNGSDAWVTALCKKLAMWWPWVAEGEIPLSAANGEEISRYKELDPTIRLLILKALCEIRADQDDTVSYINDALKNGTQLSSFSKDKIGGDGNGITYWYDGNAIIGHRLYREVKKFLSKPKVKGKEYLNVPTSSLQWETLATNLEEFRKVVDEFSSSKVMVEVSVSKTIETEALPVLEKLHKKKERALQRQQRQEMLLNGYHNSYAAGITRSCRNRKPVSYTFEDFDRVINEALEIGVTKKRKTTGVQRHEGKHSEDGKRNDIASNGGSDADTHSIDSSVRKRESIESDSTNDKLIQSGDEDDDDDKDGDL